MKYPTKSTYGLKYFRNIVIILTKGQHTKIKLGKKHLFLLPCCPPPPSLSGWGGGGWVVSTPLPPQLFPPQSFFDQRLPVLCERVKHSRKNPVNVYCKSSECLLKSAYLLSVHFRLPVQKNCAYHATSWPAFWQLAGCYSRPGRQHFKVLKLSLNV